MKHEKGVALIIVIFAMMLFAVLGVTLAVMQSGDFEVNLRNLDSERALYLAESGAQWALNQLSQNFKCTSISSPAFPHSLNIGQYSCSCDDSAGTSITVVSTGYVPSSQSNYRAMRRVKIIVVQSGFKDAIGAQEFNWHNTNSITVNGDIKALYFEGQDANTTFNDLPSDTAVPGTGSRAIRSVSPIPIDMNYYLTNASSVYNGNQTFSGPMNNKGIVYVKGNVILTGGNFNKTTIIAEGNITATGYVSLKASNSESANLSYPNLASKDGNITVQAGCDTDGLVYSQNGNLDISNISGVALMGKQIKLRGNASLSYTTKYVDSENGWSLQRALESVIWQEQ